MSFIVDRRGGRKSVHSNDFCYISRLSLWSVSVQSRDSPSRTILELHVVRGE